MKLTLFETLNEAWQLQLTISALFVHCFIIPRSCAHGTACIILLMPFNIFSKLFCVKNTPPKGLFHSVGVKILIFFYKNYTDHPLCMPNPILGFPFFSCLWYSLLWFIEFKRSVMQSTFRSSF